MTHGEDMDDMVLRLCRFTLDGEPDVGEYERLADGSGVCRLYGLDGVEETVRVHDTDGLMPDGIGDLELLNVPVTVNETTDPDLNALRDGLAGGCAMTDLILEEYKTGILDETEAAARLWMHLFEKREEE
ncbi:hypothetical protein BISA_1868 [Bifidobacterium saguini DSM 23967]|uniref:Uncharacterized protein n=1 Tax=Bifidobacterium saguini DSM 23967 TaxID=1437607 RepID=A0A087D6W9_9BIFI|nr:hypothetical protein [Bifidobacterium saguini]KFI91269.1 hypothetical protein BISA_1868 [Bifidobacterium saguini DSM 23967]